MAVFFFQAEDGIRDHCVTGVQTCALPICNFFSDWASLSFLTHIPEARGIAPRFYDGDVDACHFAMEDLGGSRSLEDLLMGADGPALHRGLTALSIQNARLHAATLGHEDRFNRI